MSPIEYLEYRAQLVDREIREAQRDVSAYYENIGKASARVAGRTDRPSSGDIGKLRAGDDD